MFSRQLIVALAATVLTLSSSQAADLHPGDAYRDIMQNKTLHGSRSMIFEIMPGMKISYD